MTMACPFGRRLESNNLSEELMENEQATFGASVYEREEPPCVMVALLA